MTIFPVGFGEWNVELRGHYETYHSSQPVKLALTITLPNYRLYVATGLNQVMASGFQPLQACTQ